MISHTFVQMPNQGVTELELFKEFYKDGLISHRTVVEIDDDCEAQLCAVEYRQLLRGQIQVEPRKTQGSAAWPRRIGRKPR
jgi:hypothetical protein